MQPPYYRAPPELGLPPLTTSIGARDLLVLRKGTPHEVDNLVLGTPKDAREGQKAYSMTRPIQVEKHLAELALPWLGRELIGARDGC